jgi:hypothetical protein
MDVVSYKAEDTYGFMNGDSLLTTFQLISSVFKSASFSFLLSNSNRYLQDWVSQLYQPESW